MARGPDGAVAAFVQIAELDQLDPQLLATDPVADVWRAHLRVHPPAAGDRVLVMRRWLSEESGELRSPAVSACLLDVKRVYMQLRPHLRRIYSAVVDLPRLAPIFVPLGFAPAGEPVVIDGTAHQPVWLDFGPGSVDGWLARLIGAETTQPAAPPTGSVIGLSSRNSRCCDSSPTDAATVRSASCYSSARRPQAATCRTSSSSSVYTAVPRPHASPPSKASPSCRHALQRSVMRMR